MDFFPQITVPTRCSKSSSSLIDQMFCKFKDPEQHLSACVIKSCISDNFPYLSIFDILKKTKYAPKFVKINRSDDNSFQAFHNEIKSHFDTFKMDPGLFCDPNINYQCFEEILLNAKSKHLAPKTVKFKSINTNYPSGWLTAFWIQSNIETTCLLN